MIDTLYFVLPKEMRYLKNLIEKSKGESCESHETKETLHKILESAFESNSDLRDVVQLLVVMNLELCDRVSSLEADIERLEEER